MKARVLIVDDDPQLREVMTEQLTEAGFAVSACANGFAALEALRGGPVEAILSDVQMPDMDGLRLLRAVRETDPDVPVVLFTGGPSLQTAIEAVEYGAIRYLTKPVSAETLIAAARQAVKLGTLARAKRAALAASGFDQLAGDRAGLEASFARGLAGLWMAHQPIVRASDGLVEGHEALLRTVEPFYAHPGVLLEAAERLGRVPELGAAIRREVAGMMVSGMLPGEAFLNVHPLDFTDDNLMDPRAPLGRFASRVVLELSERTSLEGVSEVRKGIEWLRMLGYRIAIGDFGAGYAGLTSFAAITPNVVKIDMSLIHGLEEDPVNQKLVASMARLCHGLGIRVVAEGIETEGERSAAVAAGCELLQGFLIGRPSTIGRRPGSSESEDPPRQE
jgi:EAL domain-containing protein (putative c-di-GMP-specific phosphodiesterase class I)